MRAKNKKIIFLLITAIAIGAIGNTAWAATRDDKTATSTETGDSVTVPDRPVGDVDYSPTPSGQENPAIDTKPTEPLPESTPSSQAIPVAFSYVGGSPLQVRIVINEILSTGTCSLTVTNAAGTTVTKTAPVFPASSYTTCQGFTVEDDAVKNGAVTVTVKITSGNRTGTVTQEVSR